MSTFSGDPMTSPLTIVPTQYRVEHKGHCYYISYSEGNGGWSVNRWPDKINSPNNLYTYGEHGWVRVSSLSGWTQKFFSNISEVLAIIEKE